MAKRAGAQGGEKASGESQGGSADEGPQAGSGAAPGRRWWVKVPTLGGLVIEAETEAEAREKYREAKSFIATRHPWTVEELTEGASHPEESAAVVEASGDVQEVPDVTV